MSWTCKQIVAFLRFVRYGVFSMPSTLSDPPVSNTVLPPAPPRPPDLIKETVGQAFDAVDATEAALTDAEKAHTEAVTTVALIFGKHEVAIVRGQVYLFDKESRTGYRKANNPATEDTVLD